MSQKVKTPPQSMLVSDPRQAELDLLVERQVENDGIGMGVLSDGTPFLTQRGLARLCGVENRYIGLISTEWETSKQSDRTKRVRAVFEARGETPPSVASVSTTFGGRKVLAYPDNVCMATLEYYAFEAGLAGQEKAIESFRKLASYGLRKFIYTQVGYNEAESEEDVWRIFKDRVSLTYDAVPSGYFGIFKELSSLIVTLGLSGLHIDENFVPDISVGQAWSNHWRTSNLKSRFGERATYAHHFPNYFPQAASNPQMARCYPEDALGEFRRWFREEYIGDGKFKRYLTRKVGERLLPDGYVERALLALTKE